MFITSEYVHITTRVKRLSSTSEQGFNQNVGEVAYSIYLAVY